MARFLRIIKRQGAEVQSVQIYLQVESFSSTMIHGDASVHFDWIRGAKRVTSGSITADEQGSFHWPETLEIVATMFKTGSSYQTKSSKLIFYIDSPDKKPSKAKAFGTIKFDFASLMGSDVFRHFSAALKHCKDTECKVKYAVRMGTPGPQIASDDDLSVMESPSMMSEIPHSEPEEIDEEFHLDGMPSSSQTAVTNQPFISSNDTPTGQNDNALSIGPIAEIVSSPEDTNVDHNQETQLPINSQIPTFGDVELVFKIEQFENKMGTEKGEHALSKLEEDINVNSSALETSIELAAKIDGPADGTAETVNWNQLIKEIRDDHLKLKTAFANGILAHEKTQATMQAKFNEDRSRMKAMCQSLSVSSNQAKVQINALVQEQAASKQALQKLRKENTKLQASQKDPKIDDDILKLRQQLLAANDETKALQLAAIENAVIRNTKRVPSFMNTRLQSIIRRLNVKFDCSDLSTEDVLDNLESNLESYLLSNNSELAELRSQVVSLNAIIRTKEINETKLKISHEAALKESDDLLKQKKQEREHDLANYMESEQKSLQTMNGLKARLARIVSRLHFSSEIPLNLESMLDSIDAFVEKQTDLADRLRVAHESDARHSAQWLRLAGKTVRFGDNGEFTELDNDLISSSVATELKERNILLKSELETEKSNFTLMETRLVRSNIRLANAVDSLNAVDLENQLMKSQLQAKRKPKS